MVRTILVLGVLGGVSYAVVSWATGGPESNPKGKPALKVPGEAPGEQPDGPKGQAGGGEKENKPALEKQFGPASAEIPQDSIELPQTLLIQKSRINSIKHQEVSSARSGQILVLGTEIDPTKQTKEQLQRWRDEEKLTTVKVAFVAMLATEQEQARGVPVFRIKGDNRLWRRWTEEDSPEPNKLRAVLEEKTFLRLQKGTPVRAGDLVGLVDPALGIAEVQIKIAKLDASDADLRTATKTKEESHVRYERAHRLVLSGSGSQEELGTARLTWERYVYEEKAKFQAIKVAREEMKQAHVTLRLYELRAKSSGVVREVPKSDGEAVKEGDLVAVLQNPDLLQVEGHVPVQDAKKLALGMPVVVEPTTPEAYAGVLSGHREAVNAVAVSKGKIPLVISAGEERLALVWKVTPSKDRHTGKTRWDGKVICKLRHPSAVRSVACTPPTAKSNLCLTGTADGVGRLWDLDTVVRKGGKPRELAETHREPINAVAFNAEGTVCATGSDDRSICLWDTATGKLLRRIERAHKGAVTSLSFTRANQLVSAGRDRLVVVWTLKEGEEPVRTNEIDQLGGQVDVLGVNPEGTQTLFDQGHQLRVLSLADSTPQGIITNTSYEANFTTFALFSPDGNAVLTAGSLDKSVKLWRNPVTSKKARATEMRQYMWPEARTNCAAFAPEAPFVVTGTQDHQVVIWNLPGAAEYNEAPANAIITHIDRFLDTSSRQVRIIAEVQGKTSGLTPGGTATMVVYPK